MVCRGKISSKEFNLSSVSLVRIPRPVCNGLNRNLFDIVKCGGGRYLFLINRTDSNSTLTSQLVSRKVLSCFYILHEDVPNSCVGSCSISYLGHVVISPLSFYV